MAPAAAALHAHPRLRTLARARMHALQVCMEPKVLGALEFSVCVIQSPSRTVIALPPTTFEVVDFNSDIEDHLREVALGRLEQQQGQALESTALLDDMDPHATFVSYARKYKPNSDIRTHTPAKLPSKMMQVHLMHAPHACTLARCRRFGAARSACVCPMHGDSAPCMRPMHALTARGALQAIRRSAERAFLELGLRDYARFDGWLMLHSEAQHMEFLADHVESADNPPPVPSAAELPLPGFGPLPEEEYMYENVFDMTEVRARAARRCWPPRTRVHRRPARSIATNGFFRAARASPARPIPVACIGRDRTGEAAPQRARCAPPRAAPHACTSAARRRVQEQVARLGPVFDDEPLDDYIYSPAHDRYFTPEQFDHTAALEAAAAEERARDLRAHIARHGAPPVPPPMDQLAAARGDADAAFEPVTTPADTLELGVRDLVKFDGGLVIMAEVNPVSGLEQVRPCGACMHAPVSGLEQVRRCGARAGLEAVASGAGA